jgi:hypothetical protein
MYKGTSFTGKLPTIEWSDHSVQFQGTGDDVHRDNDVVVKVLIKVSYLARSTIGLE